MDPDGAVATAGTGGSDSDEITLPCISCGYDLRELPPGGDCPECGTSIERSRRAIRLALADPGWLRSVARGQTVFALGVVVTVTGVFASMGIPMVIGIVESFRPIAPPGVYDAVDLVTNILVLAGLATATIGAYLLTGQEPRDRLREGTWSTRRFARGGLLAALGVIAADVPLERTLTGSMLEFEEVASLLLIAIALTVALVAVLTQLARLAGRIPEERLSRRASELGEMFRWAIPTFAGCAVVMSAGPKLAKVVPVPELVFTVIGAGTMLLTVGLTIMLLVQFFRLARLTLALRRAFAACVAESATVRA